MARGAADRTQRWGRWLGILPHEPERWSTQRWDAAYRDGTVSYYGQLEELARYSVIVGYVGWFMATRPTGVARILDVGCGTGLLRDSLDGMAFSGYVGVDLSEAAIRDATAKAHPRSRFLVGDVCALRLDRFDVVVLNEVLYYAPDASRFLRRIRALLEPHGVLVVSMWRHPGDRSLWRKVDNAFPLVDRVAIRNRRNAVNRRGWLVACYDGDGIVPRGPDEPG